LNRHELQALYAEALGLWGDRLVAWACGASPDERIDDLLSADGLHAEAEASLEALRDMGNTLIRASHERDPVLAATNAAAKLAVRNEEHGETTLNLLRACCDGLVPDAEDDDVLVSALRWLARDLYPAYLVLEADEGGPLLDTDAERPNLQRESLFDGIDDDHPALEEFATAARSDPRLAPLVAAIEEPRGMPGGEDFVHAGVAYLHSDELPEVPGIRLSSLARDLVEAAWDRQLIAGVADPAAALEQLPVVLGELARALAGEQVAVPAAVGLWGIDMPPGEEIRVRGGLLRAPVPSEVRRGGLFDEPVDCVLEIEHGVSIEPSTGLPDKWFAQGLHSRPYPALVQRAAEVALACALTEEAEPPAVAVAWAAVYGPVGEAIPQSGRPPRGGSVFSLEDGERRRALGDWIARVRRDGARLPTVARSRASQAMFGRESRSDGLLDALIALESLIGGGASLRLQAAVAWLLEPADYGRRRDLYEEVVELYDTRSAVVHKGKAVTHADWARAVQLLASVLRHLLSDRSDLLDEKDSRGTRLLLGG
jgi:Apea-like HEPN